MMSREQLGESLNLSADILPMDAPNRPAPKNGVDRTYLAALNYITVHETDNTRVGADAQAHRRFINNGGGDRGVSWHYSADDAEVVKHMRLNERGIHANRGNSVCVGIETCVNSDGDLTAARDRVARLVAVLLHDTGLAIDRVVQHHYWSRKNCPRRLRAGYLGLTWEQFLEMVQTYLDFANRETTSAIPRENLELEPEMAIDKQGIDLETFESEDVEDDLHEGISEKYLSIPKPTS